MLVKVFLGSELAPQKNDPDIKTVIDGFTQYKKTGNPGHMFGRDFLTLRPRDAKENELYHAHLLTKERFKLERLYLRDQDHRTSDSFLMYCCGFNNPNYFLLISIIWTNAHNFLEKETDLLRVYAKEAEKFRSMY